MSYLSIVQGSRVALHFSLALETGEVINSTFDGVPASLTIGDDSLPPYFESVLIGLSAGAKKSFKVNPEKAFGMPNKDSIKIMPRTAFQADMDLAEGLVVSFSDAANSELLGMIKTFDNNTVEVDFNHPLAGRSLQFCVQILKVG